VTTDRVLPTGILGAEAGHLGRRRPAHVFAGLYQPVLALSVALSLLALLVATVGLLVDGRLITGAAAWAKPAKFGLSVAVYFATLRWLLSLVVGRRRLVGVLGAASGVALVVELLLIDVQVVRGTTSHFNTATPFDTAVLGVMGGLVVVVFLAAAATGVLLLRQRGLPPPLASGVRAGLAVTLLGMSEAVLMIANHGSNPGGGHTVGAPDGGPGWPLLGWSTAHGDLRIAHFIGLHALQVLPLLGWALTRQVGRARRGAGAEIGPGGAERRVAALPPDAQVQVVRVVAVAYAALVGLLTWQAEAGRPLLSPSPAMLAAAATLAAATVAGVLRARRGELGLPAVRGELSWSSAQRSTTRNRRSGR